MKMKHSKTHFMHTVFRGVLSHPCACCVFSCVAVLVLCVIGILSLNDETFIPKTPVLYTVILLCTGGIFGIAFVYLLASAKVTNQMQALSETNEEFALQEELKKLSLLDKISYVLEHYPSHTQAASQEEEDLRRTRAELFALQTQINPHFLYNTLDSIRGQALIDGVEEIADTIEALSNIFKYSIGEKDNLIPLRKEIENLVYYVKIQKYRFMDKIDLELDIDGVDYHVLRTKIPKLTLQPIVENAIHHGLEPKPEKGKVTIRVLVVDTQLRITVADDGVGMDEETLLQMKKQLCGAPMVQKEGQKVLHGIALHNTNKRIQNYFGPNYGLEIYSTKGLGTRVDITVPYIKKEAYNEDRSVSM